jgi:hypothetical protein
MTPASRTVFDDRPDEPDHAEKWRRGRWLLAVAGAGLLGLALGQGFGRSSGDASPVGFEAAAVVANGRLEAVLYDPSLSGLDGGPEVSRAFRNADGQTCRRFEDGVVTGTVCQIGGDWRIMDLRQG